MVASGFGSGLSGWPPTKRVGEGYKITVRHLTAERARLYDRWVFPWTVKIIGLWILFDAFAPSLPPRFGWLDWFFRWGKEALFNALGIGERILHWEWDYIFAHWEKTSYAGWPALVFWLVAIKVIRRILPMYSWPAHRFLSKRAVVIVTPDEIRIGRNWYENEAVGQIAVMEHSDLGFHAGQDQLRRDEGGYSSGKSFYYKNAFDVVMPYHGQPVVLFSIYGSKRTADQAAARITLVRKLAAQNETAVGTIDEFGPSPSLPGTEVS
jgi:hypothetical protein